MRLNTLCFLNGFLCQSSQNAQSWGTERVQGLRENQLPWEGGLLQHCPEPLRRGQEEGAAQLCWLQAGPEHRQPSLQEGDDLRALTEVFLFGSKEKRQRIHGCCVSGCSALQATPLQKVLVSSSAAFTLPPAFS